MNALNDKGQQYHVELSKGDVGRYVILPGDPGRVELIAKFLDSPRKVAHHREDVTYTGFLEGIPVSITRRPQHRHRRGGAHRRGGGHLYPHRHRRHGSGLF